MNVSFERTQEYLDNVSRIAMAQERIAFAVEQEYLDNVSRIAMAQERIAVAVEQIADLLKEETKIGGAIWSLGRRNA